MSEEGFTDGSDGHMITLGDSLPPLAPKFRRLDYTFNKGSPNKSALDVQEGGGHYKDQAIQPIQYIHANNLGYCEANIVKYATRWKQKNGVEDLRKIKHYVDLLIELEGLDAGT